MATIDSCPTPAGTLQVRIADTFTARGLGLLVGAPLKATEGLLIAPCASIHTIGMRYPIDVVFLDAQARILRVCPDVRAGRMRFAPRARGVLELRAGTALCHGLRPGVQLPQLAAVLS
jgi:uncharacterized membrane protein (UPF0127 family)